MMNTRVWVATNRITGFKYLGLNCEDALESAALSALNGEKVTIESHIGSELELDVIRLFKYMHSMDPNGAWYNVVFCTEALVQTLDILGGWCADWPDGLEVHSMYYLTVSILERMHPMPNRNIIAAALEYAADQYEVFADRVCDTSTMTSREYELHVIKTKKECEALSKLYR